MTSLKVTFLWIALASLVPAALTACGDNGQDLNGTQCPSLPLYTWKPRAGALTPTGDQIWDRVGLDGKPLTTAQTQAITSAEKAGCVSPAGTALSLDSNGNPIPRTN